MRAGRFLLRPFSSPVAEHVTNPVPGVPVRTVTGNRIILKSLLCDATVRVDLVIAELVIPVAESRSRNSRDNPARVKLVYEIRDDAVLNLDSAIEADRS